MQAMAAAPAGGEESSLDLVSELLEALTVGVDPAGLSDAELESELVAIRRMIDVLEPCSTTRVAELHRRCSAVPGGFNAVTGFLTGSCGMSSSGARQLVRVSEALGAMPRTRRLFEAGEISAAKVRVLASGATAYPDLFEEHEETLVEAARTLTVGRLRRVVDYWRSAIDWDAATAETEDLHSRRFLYVSRTFEGMVKLDGLFDPVDGETLLAALAAVTTPSDRASGTDPDVVPYRSAVQRRADGLVDLARSFLDRGEVTVAGERPHVSLVVDVPTLQRLHGSRCELEHTGHVPSADHARMIACDSSVTRIVVGPDSEPLDVGRRTRTIPPAIRRALTVRDGGCRWPGCDRPPDWCDGHHLVHWADGGHTRLDNLVLLCRRHHRAVHTGMPFHPPDDG